MEMNANTTGSCLKSVSVISTLMDSDNCTHLDIDHSSQEKPAVSSPSALIHALGANQLIIDPFRKHAIFAQLLPLAG